MAKARLEKETDLKNHRKTNKSMTRRKTKQEKPIKKKQKQESKNKAS